MDMTENNVSDNGKSADWHDEAGRFQKGNPGKPRGATKNRLRDQIKNFIDTEWQNFPKWFATLKEEKKIEVLLDLMPYGISRLQSISMTDDEGNPAEKGIDFSRWSDDDLRILLSLQTKYGNGDTI